MSRPARGNEAKACFNLEEFVIVGISITSSSNNLIRYNAASNFTYACSDAVQLVTYDSAVCVAATNDSEGGCELFLRDICYCSLNGFLQLLFKYTMKWTNLPGGGEALELGRKSIQYVFLIQPTRNDLFASVRACLT
jgi:hypothetical protein